MSDNNNGTVINNNNNNTQATGDRRQALGEGSSKLRYYWLVAGGRADSTYNRTNTHAHILISAYLGTFLPGPEVGIIINNNQHLGGHL